MRITVESHVDTSGLRALGEVVSSGLLSRIVRKAAFDLLAEAIRRITDTAKSGRVYVRLGALKIKTRRDKKTGDHKIVSVTRKKTYHRASAPGEAPASDTGALVGSGFVRIVSDLLAHVGFNAKYARILELHRQRPFLLPAMEEIGPQLTRAIAAAVAKAIEQASKSGGRSG